GPPGRAGAKGSVVLPGAVPPRPRQGKNIASLAGAALDARAREALCFRASLEGPLAERHPIVILGGGLTGTSVAYHLGEGYRLLERDARLGGLVQTERLQGFLFDKTGHYFHVRDPYTKALLKKLLPGGLVQIARRSMVFSHDVYTRYPFQANTYRLPPEIVKECLLGFVQAPARTGVASE